jgi:hypothetical protein
MQRRYPEMSDIVREEMNKRYPVYERQKNIDLKTLSNYKGTPAPQHIVYYEIDIFAKVCSVYTDDKINYGIIDYFSVSKRSIDFDSKTLIKRYVGYFKNDAGNITYLYGSLEFYDDRYNRLDIIRICGNWTPDNDNSNLGINFNCIEFFNRNKREYYIGNSTDKFVITGNFKSISEISGELPYYGKVITFESKRGYESLFAGYIDNFSFGGRIQTTGYYVGYVREVNGKICPYGVGIMLYHLNKTGEQYLGRKIHFGLFKNGLRNGLGYTIDDIDNASIRKVGFKRMYKNDEKKFFSERRFFYDKEKLISAIDKLLFGIHKCFCINLNLIYSFFLTIGLLNPFLEKSPSTTTITDSGSQLETLNTAILAPSICKDITYNIESAWVKGYYIGKFSDTKTDTEGVIKYFKNSQLLSMVMDGYGKLYLFDSKTLFMGFWLNNTFTYGLVAKLIQSDYYIGYAKNASNIILPDGLGLQLYGANITNNEVTYTGLYFGLFKDGVKHDAGFEIILDTIKAKLYNRGEFEEGEDLTFDIKDKEQIERAIANIIFGINFCYTINLDVLNEIFKNIFNNTNFTNQTHYYRFFFSSNNIENISSGEYSKKSIII